MLRAALPFLLILGLTGCSRSGDPNRVDLIGRTSAMNVLVVALDAAAADHFAFLGYDRDTTPVLSALAEEAVVFETAYAQASATPLSVFSYFTSRYPLVDREIPEPGEVAPVFPSGLATLAGELAGRFGRRGGFSANQWVCRRLGYDAGFTDFFELWDEDTATPEESVAQTAVRVSEAAIEWLAKEGPFFAYLHYLEPHVPYTPPAPYSDRFDPTMRGHVDGTPASLAPYREVRPRDAVVRNTIALYDGNLAYVDAEFGRVVETLKAAGVWEQTIVILLSDHGEAFWQHGLRGHGKHAYEEFVRVPLFVRIPGLTPRRVSVPVQLVDLMPTVLDLADVAGPVESMVGRSWVPLLLGEDAARAPIAFFRNHVGGEWIYGLRDGRFKYLSYFGRQIDDLFDLTADPLEKRNLLQKGVPGGSYDPVQVARKMSADLNTWIQAGMAMDAGLSSAGADSLDAEAVERLKAMGYFH